MVPNLPNNSYNKHNNSCFFQNFNTQSKALVVFNNTDTKVHELVKQNCGVVVSDTLETMPNISYTHTNIILSKLFNIDNSTTLV
jgi:hypothetical protein